MEPVTFVSKFKSLRVLIKPAETTLTKEGLVKTLKAARFAQFVGGFYTTSDENIVAILDKTRDVTRLDDAERVVVDGQATKEVLPPGAYLTWKEAIELLGGDEKVLRRFIALKKVEVVQTNKGKRYGKESLLKLMAGL